MQEMHVQSLSQEDPLEKEMETHSSILAWVVPWTEEPGALQSMIHRFRHNLATGRQKEHFKIELIIIYELLVIPDQDTTTSLKLFVNGLIEG